MGSTKTIIAGAVERGGNVKAAKVRYVGIEAPKFVFDNVAKGTVLMTDEARHYHRMIEKGFNHRTINHSLKQYVLGGTHTNTIEGFWSLFKRGINGIQHSVSDKHINRYLTEYAYR